MKRTRYREARRIGRIQEYDPVAWRCSTCRLLVLAVLAGVFLTTACRQSDRRSRYHLAGTVSYRGVPVPAGTVTLLPDAACGNRGPGISIEIREGRYDTRFKGVGHVGGPHVMMIVALDGRPDKDSPRGSPVFPAYEMKVDLPKTITTLDLEIPHEWVAPPEYRRPDVQAQAMSPAWERTAV